MRLISTFTVTLACAALLAGCEQPAQTRDASTEIAEPVAAVDPASGSDTGCPGAPCATQMEEPAEAQTSDAKTRNASSDTIQALAAAEGRGPEGGCPGAPCATAMQEPAEAARTIP